MSRFPATLGSFILGGVCGGVSVCSSGNEPIPTWLPVRLLVLLPLLELRCESCGWLLLLCPVVACCIELLVFAGFTWVVAAVGGPVNALIWGLLGSCCWYEPMLWSVSMLYWRDPPRNPDGGALPYAVLLYCSMWPLPGLAIWWGAS